MKVMVDSNILIFSNVADMPEYPGARDKLFGLIDDGCTFAVNTIILSEVNYKLQKILSRDEAYKRTKSLLHSDYFEYFPVGQTTLERAIDLCHGSKMRINDAVIAQHCLDLKIDGLFTDNVKDFRQVPGLHLIHLRESKN